MLFLDSNALSYNSQASYHLTTASKHVQLAFTSLLSETGRYASQLVYSTDICEYARISSPDNDFFLDYLVSCQEYSSNHSVSV